MVYLIQFWRYDVTKSDQNFKTSIYFRIHQL